MLYKKNLCPEDTFEGDGAFHFIAFYAKNRAEWVQFDIASAISGITSVALYDTLGKESIELIISQCRVRTCALSADKVKGITALKKSGMLATLENLVYFDTLSDEDK